MSAPFAGRLVLLGAGKMGSAMLSGWLEAGIDAERIAVVDPAPPPEASELIAANAISLNPEIASISDPRVLVIAVKPQVLEDACQALVPLAAGDPLIISIAAGKTIATFERLFGAGARVVRTIPNTPAAIGRGITAMTANANVAAADMELAEALLAALGEVVRVDHEDLIDAATAVSGSGPAYVFYLSECLAAAGVDLGLPQDVATKLARATVAGAGELMRHSGIDAATLRANVTSPGGTTQAALDVLMADDGLRDLMARAVAAANRRSRQLAG